MILSKTAYLHEVEIMLVYTRLGDLKIRCGAIGSLAAKVGETGASHFTPLHAPVGPS